jgi:hypothetical protein
MVSGLAGWSNTLNWPESTCHNYYKRNLMTWIFMKITSSARTFEPTSRWKLCYPITQYYFNISLNGLKTKRLD